jgi:hypothetical protein
MSGRSESERLDSLTWNSMRKLWSVGKKRSPKGGVRMLMG